MAYPPTKFHSETPRTPGGVPFVNVKGVIRILPTFTVNRVCWTRGNSRRPGFAECGGFDFVLFSLSPFVLYFTSYKAVYSLLVLYSLEQNFNTVFEEQILMRFLFTDTLY